jgi:hypothetical protein
MDEFNGSTLLLSTFAMLYIIHGVSVFVADFRSDWEANMRELRRPWKLVTLAAGFSWLLYGALFYNISDWDVGVSIIMAAIAYVAAPWCARAVIQRKWALWSGVLIMCWFGVDGSYVLWHNLVGNQAYRAANFPASMSLFWLCGFIWLPRGSLREIISCRAALR